MPGSARRGRLRRRFRHLALAVLAGGPSWVGAAGGGRAADLAPPAQFLVDKETAVAAIVQVRATRSRWAILPDGDHLPLIVADCRMEEALSGTPPWPEGESREVTQHDYTELIFDRIAPPVIDGRRYVVWLVKASPDGEVPGIGPWMAHPQGFLQIRSQGDGEFVFWNGRRYAVSAIRDALAGGRRLPLNEILDPSKRLRVAEERLARRDLGDEDAFVQGLLINVLDPAGQAARVDRPPPSETSTDIFGMAEGEGQPHALWYGSLALLRDLGREETMRDRVVAALTPVAQTSRPVVRLAAALALVDLGSDAGREALVRGYESDSGPVSSDPPSRMTFPGRYPYDDSSTTACAHALARLGDRRGLSHPEVDVRLAAAEALRDHPDAELRSALAALSEELQPEVEKLRSGGKLAAPRSPGDHTNRYPEAWIRTQRLLARIGDDRALGRLVEAYLVDAATYPDEERPLFPRGRPVTWSRGPSPGQAIHAVSDRPEVVLDRLRRAYGDDPRWSDTPLVRLRESLEPAASEPPAAAPATVTAAEVAERLAASDPERRAEGLAAAGYHRMEAFYARVLEAALRGEGIERSAGIYALGLYGRDVPEKTLRRLVAVEDLDLRLAALELATRRTPARFAAEMLQLVREMAGRAAAAPPDDWQARRGFEYLPRIVCRLARGPLPEPLLEALADPDPVIRRIVVQSLELSGNPDAVPSLEALARGDPDPATREASRVALRFLGPPE